ncbi:hypothetical protein O6H91_18G024500 [Diphasiastrum complanatum]|nr:hypothetical protein O6H91_18G024500 [Diphasiastrum complanatum]
MSAALVMAFVTIDSSESEGTDSRTAVAMLAILIWICIWWATEALPIAMTSLLPILLFPILGIRDADAVSKAYMNDTITLFIGSFILARAVERYHVHRRLALKSLLVFGGQRMEPRLLLLGFCVGPAFVSMWISNTATAIMMMPMSIGVLQKLQASSAQQGICDEIGCSESPREEKLKFNRDDLHKVKIQSSKVSEFSQDLKLDVAEFTERNQENFNNRKIASPSEESNSEEDVDALKIYGRGVVLAIAYGVSIGGLTTLTGTGTNLIFSGMWSSRFPNAPPISYFQWFCFAFPLGVVLLIFLWLLLCSSYCPTSAISTISRSFNKSTIQEESDLLGPVTFAESTVLTLFGVLAALWMTRCLSRPLLGWGILFGGSAGDGTASILMAMLLFLIPNGIVPGEKLMSWKHCKQLPWDIVLLLGAGFALADGIVESGLSSWVTKHLEFLQSAPYLLMVPIVSLLVGITTEFTSNNSAATIFLPLLAEVSLSINMHPLFLMVPATISASYAFMLPISTPPDAVAYATGYLRMIDMIKTGFILKVFAMLLLSAMMPTLGTIVFGLNKPFQV